ncbi:hypothetical protein LOZ53_002896, partial [Ophidiomyces ophidiicola]
RKRKKWRFTKKQMERAKKTAKVKRMEKARKKNQRSSRLLKVAPLLRPERVSVLSTQPPKLRSRVRRKI